MHVHDAQGLESNTLRDNVTNTGTAITSDRPVLTMGILHHYPWVIVEEFECVTFWDKGSNVNTRILSDCGHFFMYDLHNFICLL